MSKYQLSHVYYYAPPRERGNTWKGVAIVLIVLFAVGVGYGLYTGQIQAFFASWGKGEEEEDHGTPPSGQYQLTLGVTDAVTGDPVSATDTVVDVFLMGQDGKFSYTKYYETIDVSDSAVNGAKFYKPGDKIRLHFYSTSGNGYYDKWYPESDNAYITLTESMLTGTPEVTRYFNIDSTLLELYQRPDPDNLLFAAYSPAQTVLSSADGDTFDSTATEWSATSDTFNIKVEWAMDSYSIAWGLPVTTVTSSFKLEHRVTVCWVAINDTAVDPSLFLNKGWTLCSVSTPGWWVFCIEINPIISTQTTTDSDSLLLPFDTSACTNTNDIQVSIYFQDYEIFDHAVMGVSDGIPNTYGISGYGPATTLPASPVFELDSSQNPTNPVLQFVIDVY